MKKKYIYKDFRDYSWLTTRPPWAKESGVLGKDKVALHLKLWVVTPTCYGWAKMITWTFWFSLSSNYWIKQTRTSTKIKISFAAIFWLFPSKRSFQENILEAKFLILFSIWEEHFERLWTSEAMLWDVSKRIQSEFLIQFSCKCIKKFKPRSKCHPSQPTAAAENGGISLRWRHRIQSE